MSDLGDMEARIKAKAEERIEKMKTALTNAMVGIGSIEAMMIQKYHWAEKKQRDECLLIALKARKTIDRMIKALEEDKKEEDKKEEAKEI